VSADATQLDEWVAAEIRYAATAMTGAISATHLAMERPGFGQRVVPRPGSVLASPVVAHYDPEPDYFFHWFRDAAIVIDGLRVALAEGYVAPGVLGRLREFVEFSLALRSLDGRAFSRDAGVRARTQPAFLQYLRPDTEMEAIAGARVAGDVRVNADGTLDFIRWGRPQADGPALECIALLRWWRELPESAARLRTPLAALIDSNLAFTLGCLDEPCFDIWEEHSGHHYHTQLLQLEALRLGSAWLEERRDPQRARAAAAAAARIAPRLAALWSARQGFYRARASAGAGRGEGVRESDHEGLDTAVILGVLHAGRSDGTHSVLDPRVQATLTALEELFERAYAINRGRPPARGAAMGRYAGDRYYSGGAYFFSTLAAAEFYFRLASALRSGAALAVTGENQRFRQRLEETPAAVAAGPPAVDAPPAAGEPPATRAPPAVLAMQRGDALLRTVQAFTPSGGELAEQFDQTTGAPASARHLSWSYAAFITAAASRAQAARTTRG
jgi:glucoamylase